MIYHRIIPSPNVCTYLKEHLVQFHKGDGLASTHVAAVTKAEFHKPFHLLSVVFARLGEPLGTEDVGVDTKVLLGREQRRRVHADRGPARDELAVDRVPLGRYSLGIQARRGRPLSKAFVYDGLETLC